MIGRWRVEWSAHADRHRYIHEIAKDPRWDTPEEVRLYLPNKSEDQLLECCNEGDVQASRVNMLEWEQI